MSPTRRISPRLAAGLAAALAIVTFGPLSQIVSAHSAAQAAGAQPVDQKVESQRLDTKADPGDQPRVSLPPSLAGLRGMVHMPRYRTSSLLQPVTWVPSRSDVLLDGSAGAEPASRSGVRRAAFDGPRARPAPGSSTGADSLAGETLTSGAASGAASSPTPAGAGAELDGPGPIVSMPPVLRGTRGEIKRAAYAYTATYDAPSQPSSFGDPTSRGKTIYGAGGEIADPGTGLDPEGWTILTKSPDTRVVYVSSSEGSDLNSGLSESTPVKTIAKGKSLVRMGYPDWLLLKRGDEWEESFGRWDIYGRSESERLVLGAYGEGARPLLKSGAESGLKAMNHKIKHVIVTDLDFWAHTREPSHPQFDPAGGTGLYILGASEDVTIEGCRFRTFGTNIVVQQYEDQQAKNLSIRRNIIADAYSTTSHSQGLFVQGGDGLLLEENIFDGNGWHPAIPDANPTQFNHNVYLTSSKQVAAPMNDIVIRGNVFANASALGVKIYAGGVRSITNTLVEDNVFYACADGFRQHTDTYPGFVNAIVRNNVFTEMGRILKGTPQSWGLSMGSVEGAEITGNIFAHKDHDSTSFAVMLEGQDQPFSDVEIGANIVYTWNRGMIRILSANLSSVLVRENVIQDVHAIKEMQYLAAGASGVTYFGNTYHSPLRQDEWFLAFDQRLDLPGWIAATDATNEKAKRVGFVAPQRTVDTYDLATGGTGSGPSLLSRCREMDRASWDPQLTGSALFRYFAEGFAIEP